MMKMENNKETEIVITNETNAIAVYKVNYEDVKNYLATELKKYENILVTEEYMSMAKKSRAELNAMKKDLQARLSEVRNAQLKPYNDLKTNYTDALEKMIDEQLVKIDNAIKEIEKKKAEEKEKEIIEYFNTVKGEIDVFFKKVKADVEVIESFDDEFVIPLKNIYLKCFDMSAVMRNKVEFDREKQKRLEAEAEAERLRKELEEQKAKENAESKTEFLNGYFKEDTDIPSENAQSDLTVVEEIPEANTPEDTKTLQETSPALANETQNTVQIERIEFWVEVTPEQKLLMRNFVLENHIKCGKIVR